MSDANDFNNSVIAEFRASGGIVGGPFAGAPMILVTHKGAKSGKEYTTPLVHSKHGEDHVVIASMGGAPADPQWYRNMVANPSVVVEVGTEKFTANVREATGAERDSLYRAQAALMSNFDDYAAATTRTIPVLVLTRA